MIPADFIDDLLARTDIVDLIDAYVPLKKSGANYMACCPFHREKSPSFSVSPHKQFYHCFGCGAHGSAIGFLMEYQRLSFTEAVQLLADRHGMTVPHAGGKAGENAAQRAERRKKQASLEETLERAAGFYSRNLAASEAASGYLKKRGLDAETIARYGLGYAPDARQGLSACFSPYPDAALAESGMVAEKEGRSYDRFRNRIMFPIRNGMGQVIGFGGRVLDDSKPKYLNSPDTPLFDKGKNLYGLYESRTAVKEAGRILVVEGYMDVVALAQHGIAYAVAALGTATTADHINLLMRQSSSIFFCFDGDRAGRQAARRAMENALPRLQDGKSLHFLFLPEGHDPDSYVREYGKTRFEDALANQSKTLSAYFWDALGATADLSTQEGKARLVKTATPLLAQITNAPALAYLLKQELAQRVGIDTDNLAYLMGQEAPKRHIAEKRYTLPRKSPSRPKMLTLAEKQIRSLLRNPQWAAYTELPETLDFDEDLACLAALAAYIRRQPQQRVSEGQMIEAMRQTPYFPHFSRLISSETFPHTKDGLEDIAEKQQFIDGMERLMQHIRKHQIDQLMHEAGTRPLSREEKQLLRTLLRHTTNDYGRTHHG